MSCLILTTLHSKCWRAVFSAKKGLTRYMIEWGLGGGIIIMLLTGLLIVRDPRARYGDLMSRHMVGSIIHQ